MGMTTVWLTRRADTPANRLDHRKIVPDFQINRLSSLPSALTAYIEKKST
jgi:FMN phosphatase YigB (HAD superfamily)